MKQLTLRQACRIAKIKRVLRMHDASLEFVKTAAGVYKTLHAAYDMDFRRIRRVFDAFLAVHAHFRSTGWEAAARDTLKNDPHFMRVWARLLDRSKPLLLSTAGAANNNDLALACLYLTYALHGVEINYPMRPFLRYVDNAAVIYRLALRIVNDHFSIDVLTTTTSTDDA